MPKLVLMVDDDPASLTLMTRVLQRAGHLVIDVASGLQAHRALDAARFDVIVTDIFMPDMDGLELIRHVCASYPHTPIIAISGGAAASSPDFLPIASALGADMVLSKPVSPAALRCAVDGVTADLSKGIRRTALAHATQGSVMMDGEEALAQVTTGRP